MEEVEEGPRGDTRPVSRSTEKLLEGDARKGMDVVPAPDTPERQRGELGAGQEERQGHSVRC